MYDERCKDLAELFLSDHPANTGPEVVVALAQTIQDAVEGFLVPKKDEATVAQLKDIIRSVATQGIAVLILHKVSGKISDEVYKTTRDLYIAALECAK